LKKKDIQAQKLFTGYHHFFITKIINQVLHGAVHVLAKIIFFPFYLRVILI